MLGAIIGDIVGSRFEFNNIKSKNFALLHPDCFFTDDTVMTLAIAEALMLFMVNGGDLQQLAILSMRRYGKCYPCCGYGSRFESWLASDKPIAYNSWGNGAAMRISSCGWLSHTLEEVKRYSHELTVVTHNHPEGLKGAECTAVCIYLARTGATKQEIDEALHRYYPERFTIDALRPSYKFYESCQQTVPQAVQCFLEAKDFEDTLRNAISIGGDSDTLAAIAGAIAEPFFGIDENLARGAQDFLNADFLQVLRQFDLTKFESKVGGVARSVSRIAEKKGW